MAFRSASNVLCRFVSTVSLMPSPSVSRGGGPIFSYCRRARRRVAFHCCQSSVMTILPLARPCSAYASASMVWSNGNVLPDDRAEVVGVVAGTRLPASDPSRHPEWRDDHESALRFAGRPPRCRGSRPRQWGKEPGEAPVDSRASGAHLSRRAATSAAAAPPSRLGPSTSSWSWSGSAMITFTTMGRQDNGAVGDTDQAAGQRDTFG
jgi:hypothetical protein